MKSSSKKKKQADQPKRLPAAAPKGSRFRWIVLSACLLLSGGGTWLFMEYVVWNILPPEFVGKWEVVQGPPEFREAIFHFYRNGNMVGGFNENGNLREINAKVRVVENELHITTRHSITKEKLTTVQIIRAATGSELQLEDDRGQLIRLRRADF